MVQAPPHGRRTGADTALDRGRACCSHLAWADAYKALTLADSSAKLAAEDLERLALSAYMSGDDDAYLTALERAHHAHLEVREGQLAARCAFWVGLRLAFRGEMSPATGWFARAQRLIDAEASGCVEHGWLLLPVAEQRLVAGDPDAAYAAAVRAAAVGKRFQDLDLAACALHLQGRIRVQEGELREGLALLDEAMVAVVAGELSPIVTGLIYCCVFAACQEVYAYRRAREWTTALTRWCEAQPQMIAFTGTCLLHRAEILQINGDWAEAIEEARRACERLVQANNTNESAAALYRVGEIHRLRGAFAEAETAYRRASKFGMELQPGFSLLRLAQGRAEAAAAAIRRALAAVSAGWSGAGSCLPM